MQNKKLQVKLLFVALLCSDLGYFYRFREQDPLRIARVIRPGWRGANGCGALGV